MAYRVKADESVGQTATFEVHEFTRVTHAPLGMSYGHPMSFGSGDSSGTLNVIHAAAVPLRSRQLKCILKGGSVLLEPGALQYAHGQIQVDVAKNDQRGNMLTRMVTSAATGESGFSTRYTGTGEVWTEPTRKYLVLASMDASDGGMLLDDRAFYACEGTIRMSTHMHRSIQGVLSGNGLMQPKLEGSGVFVVESPVHPDEIEQVDLDGSKELIVDGDLMLMYTATLQVELRPLTRGIRNTFRSGEGLVYVIRGRGSVWLTPSAPIGH